MNVGGATDASPLLAQAHPSNVIIAASQQ